MRRNPTTAHRLLPCPLPARASIAPSSPASRPFVLAALRALRLDPGCGCRTPQTRRKRPEKRSQQTTNPALTSSAASGMTPVSPRIKELLADSGQSLGDKIAASLAAIAACSRVLDVASNRDTFTDCGPS